MILMILLQTAAITRVREKRNVNFMRDSSVTVIVRLALVDAHAVKVNTPTPTHTHPHLPPHTPPQPHTPHPPHTPTHTPSHPQVAMMPFIHLA